MKRFVLATVLLLAALLVGGCPTVEGACEDCCKAKLKSLVKSGRLSSQEGYRERKACIEYCVKRAESLGKDADWIEKNRACN